jgi:ABC-2 type transport system permease protein
MSATAAAASAAPLDAKASAATRPPRSPESLSRWLREVRAAARLDLAEVLRSRWLLFSAVIYAVLVAVFVLVGLRESTLLGFTGMGRVVMSMTHALLLVLPLLALTATAQVVNRARDDGSLELLFTQPLGRGAWFVGVSLVRLGTLVVPLVVLLAGLGLVGQLILGHVVPWGFVGRAIAITASQLAAFAGLGLAISTAVRHPARVTVAVLGTWALAVALLDFGLIALMLRWQLNPRVVFALAALNPVECGRLALLSGLTPDLATLGPVGFYLSTQIGPARLFVLGLAWPLVVAGGSWLWALNRFSRGDLV